MKRKLLKKMTAMLFALIGVFYISACSDEEKPKLVMATEATFPPYEYYEADGTTINGIDPEIMKVIAEELGYELVIEPTSFDYILTAVKKGAVDVGASGITATEERKKNVDFTIPYAGTRQVIVVPSDSQIRNPADLKGKLIGVQRGSTGDDYVTKNIQVPTRLANGEIAFEVLAAGKLDAIVLDEAPARIHQMKYKKMKILDTALTQEEYAFAIRKGRTDLLEKMNKIIARMNADRSIAKITEKHEKKTAKNKDKDAAAQVLHVFVEPYFPPYCFIQCNKIIGIDYDIISAICSEHGYEALFHNKPFDSLVDDIKNGKADIGASSISITEERCKIVDFTIPYLCGTQRIIVPKTSDINNSNQLKGKRIGVIYGSTSEIIVSAKYGEPERYSDAEKIVRDLAQGVLDAVIMDSDPVILLINRHDNLKLLPDILSKESYGFAFKKGRKELVEKFNKSLKRMISDGTIQKIRSKYMNGLDLPENKE